MFTYNIYYMYKQWLYGQGAAMYVHACYMYTLHVHQMQHAR